MTVLFWIMTACAFVCAWCFFFALVEARDWRRSAEGWKKAAKSWQDAAALWKTQYEQATHELEMQDQRQRFGRR